MARAKVVKLGKSAPARAVGLSAGIHAAQIELRSGDSYRVRAPTGELVNARLADGVSKRFADECMRDRRTVLVSSAGEGPVLVIGALQTQSTASRDAHDTLRLSGKRVELEAEEGISIQVGKSTLRLDKHGAIKLTGQRMTMDVTAVVRVLSALVELP